jgi:hypothetical protein
MERKFSKRTKQWCAVKVLQPKQYLYIPNLLLNIFEKRATTKGCVSRKVRYYFTQNLFKNQQAKPRPGYLTGKPPQ